MRREANYDIITGRSKDAVSGFQPRREESARFSTADPVTGTDRISLARKPQPPLEPAPPPPIELPIARLGREQVRAAPFGQYDYNPFRDDHAERWRRNRDMKVGDPQFVDLAYPSKRTSPSPPRGRRSPSIYDGNPATNPLLAPPAFPTTRSPSAPPAYAPQPPQQQYQQPYQLSPMIAGPGRAPVATHSQAVQTAAQTSAAVQTGGGGLFPAVGGPHTGHSAQQYQYQQQQQQPQQSGYSSANAYVRAPPAAVKTPARSPPPTAAQPDRYSHADSAAHSMGAAGAGALGLSGGGGGLSQYSPTFIPATRLNAASPSNVAGAGADRAAALRQLAAEMTELVRAAFDDTSTRVRVSSLVIPL